MTATIRILIVDDHAIFRQGLRLLLQGDAQMHVVGEAAGADVALALATEHQPDIILLDVDLEGFDGLDVVEALRTAAPAARIIILTGVRTPQLQTRALQLGARGFVLKEHSADLVLRAIHKVREGEFWFDRGTMGAAVSGLLKQSADSYAPISVLTPRELDIVRLVGEGLRNDAIAKRLTISDKTVRNQLTIVFEKVGVRDRLHLAIYAYRRGLAKLPL
jgi:DNA-binding NarL/FixJ family response regulator